MKKPTPHRPAPSTRPVRLATGPAPGTPGGKPKRPAPGLCPTCSRFRVWHTDPDGSKVAVCADCTVFVIADAFTTGRRA